MVHFSRDLVTSTHFRRRYLQFLADFSFPTRLSHSKNVIRVKLHLSTE
jgi:hypothetical protein